MMRNSDKVRTDTNTCTLMYRNVPKTGKSYSIYNENEFIMIATCYELLMTPSS